LSLTAIILVTFSIVAPGAKASIGVGIQANPVSLPTVAHPGGSYALPKVHVANTGSQDETVTLKVERLGSSSRKVVPPSWIRISGASMQLSPHQQAFVPLELVVPDNARPGKYLSDLVVTGSTAASGSGMHFGAGTATELEFRIAPGAPGGFWSWLQPVACWVVAGLLLLALARFAAGRYRLQVRLERKTASRPT
jgi:hypothetical protein